MNIMSKGDINKDLVRLFNDPRYRSYVHDITTGSYDEQVLQALSSVPSDAYNLLINGNSKLTVDSELVHDVIKEMTNNKDWHVCYLCPWSRQCTVYENNGNEQEMQSKVLRIVKNSGTDNNADSTPGWREKITSSCTNPVILLSPQGRKVLQQPFLNKHMSNGEFSRQLYQDTLIEKKIQGTCIVPNLFEEELVIAEPISIDTNTVWYLLVIVLALLLLFVVFHR